MGQSWQAGLCEAERSNLNALVSKKVVYVLWSKQFIAYHAVPALEACCDELDFEQGHAAAEERWKHWCFDLECKQIHEFREPVTKAEAYAAWANIQYSWKSCARWWDQHPKSDATPREMDEESRTRIRTRLKHVQTTS